MAYAVAAYNLNGSNDIEYPGSSLKYLTSERDKIAVAIAEKKLELFELQGA